MDTQAGQLARELAARLPAAYDRLVAAEAQALLGQAQKALEAGDWSTAYTGAYLVVAGHRR